jgi:hypothetical protein
MNAWMVATIALWAVAQMYTGMPGPWTGHRYVPISAHLGSDPIAGLDVGGHVGDSESA